MRIFVYRLRHSAKYAEIDFRTAALSEMQYVQRAHTHLRGVPLVERVGAISLASPLCLVPFLFFHVSNVFPFPSQVLEPSFDLGVKPSQIKFDKARASEAR